MKQLCFHVLILIGFFCLAGCIEQNSTSQPLGGNTQAEDPFDPDRPPTAKTLYVMADILASQGRDRESQTVLERMIKEYPDFLPAYNSLAELQMRNRRIPEAIKTLSSGLEVNPKDPVFLNNLGMCWLLRKDYEKALTYFTQATELNPENTRYRSNMATALVLLDRREEALSLYEQILPKEEAMENIKILCETVK